MTRSTFALGLAIVALAACDKGGASAGEGAPAPAPSPTVECFQRLAAPTIPDEELTDQDGRTRRLYTDVMKGRLVVLDFVFTRCTTICSPMTATMARAQRQLREQGVDDVRFVSVSIDPAGDTPARLKDFATKFGVTEDFTFLTGEPARVERALKALQGFAAVKETHAPVFLVGDEASGKWKRVFGIVSPKVLVEEVLELRAARGAASPSVAVDAGAREGGR